MTSEPDTTIRSVTDRPDVDTQLPAGEKAAATAPATEGTPTPISESQAPAGTDRPDVDTLAETVAKYRPVSSGQKHADEFDDALSDLAARARDARNMMYEANAKWEAMWLAEQEAKEAAEADRDYFAKGMGLLRNDRDRLQAELAEWRDSIATEKLTQRVTELEAALRDGANVAAQYMDTERGDLDGWIDRARALAGDGGGA